MGGGRGGRPRGLGGPRGAGDVDAEGAGVTGTATTRLFAPSAPNIRVDPSAEYVTDSAWPCQGAATASPSPDGRPSFQGYVFAHR